MLAPPGWLGRRRSLFAAPPKERWRRYLPLWLIVLLGALEYLDHPRRASYVRILVPGHCRMFLLKREESAVSLQFTNPQPS